MLASFLSLYYRTLTDKLVQGVAKGFEKKLQLVGVGYRAALDKNELVLNLGFSHQVIDNLKWNTEHLWRGVVVIVNRRNHTLQLVNYLRKWH